MMENEVRTKDIEGFENYTIDTLGRVYSKKNKIYLGQNLSNGYLRVALFKSNKNNQKFVHRLLAEAFIPNPDYKKEVDHINRIKTDNRLENLRWTTSSENCQNRDISSRNKTGFLGVSVEKKRGKLKYRAGIMTNGKRIATTFPYTDDGLRLASEWYIYQKRILHIENPS